MGQFFSTQEAECECDHDSVNLTNHMRDFERHFHEQINAHLSSGNPQPSTSNVTNAFTDIPPKESVEGARITSLSIGSHQTTMSSDGGITFSSEMSVSGTRAMSNVGFDGILTTTGAVFGTDAYTTRYIGGLILSYPFKNLGDKATRLLAIELLSYCLKSPLSTDVVIGLPVTLEGEMCDNQVKYGCIDDQISLVRLRYDRDYEAIAHAFFTNNPNGRLMIVPSPTTYMRPEQTILVVDIGDSETRVIPVSQGEIFWPGVCILPTGAKHVVDHMKWVMYPKHGFKTIEDRKHIIDILSKCYVSNTRNDLTNSVSADPLASSTSHQLEGSDLVVPISTEELYEAGEFLFNPTRLQCQKGAVGLGHFVATSLFTIHNLKSGPHNTSGPEFEKVLKSAVILTGSISSMNGLAQRLSHEICANVTVVDPKVTHRGLFESAKNGTLLSLQAFNDAKLGNIQ